MTRITKQGILIIEPEPDGICQYCGKNAELRPYGLNGARICYECGMKNKETTREMFNKILDSIKPQPIN